eukprot:15360387-Ditylum_brightwellii.AAC.1
MFLNSLNFTPAALPEGGEEGVESAAEAVVGTMEEKQQKARKHVKQNQAQRKFANEYMEQAHQDVQNNIEFSKHHFCLTMDMGQNLFNPALNAEQVGDTFYLTPITVLVFGVNDNSRPGPDCNDLMNVYLWNEADGRRGSNNITLCLLKDYKKRGFFNGTTNNSLVVIADNCSGHNKNEEV